jgi:hypothetical protein
MRALSRMSQKNQGDRLAKSLPLETISDTEQASLSASEPGSRHQTRVDLYLKEDNTLLSDREKQVLIRRFRLDDRQKAGTLEQVGKELGLSKELVPSKIPMAHPGIPLFFRSFPCKYSLIGDPEDYFNLLYIITDGDDRVVGIQFVCENPRSSKMTLPKVEFLTYNYVLNRRKAATTLKVGCVVTKSSDDVLLIESWLFDVRRDKCLEIVRLYLPKRIADFLRHVTEVRLGLTE